MKQKKTANKMASVPVVAGRRKAVKKRPTVGKRIIEGLEQAVAWTRGGNQPGTRVTLAHVPDVDVREVRQKMGLSQAQFATKFGLPPATLRNWEQGRARPDAPTRVLIAVIAKHPEAVEEVLAEAT
jgi:putative transcriptional regulator